MTIGSINFVNCPISDNNFGDTVEERFSLFQPLHAEPGR